MRLVFIAFVVNCVHKIRVLVEFRVVFSFAFWAAIFHRVWSSCIDVAIVLTMYIKLCIFVYIVYIIVYITVTPCLICRMKIKL